MKCNYHTHTLRCMHAEGSDESYVRAAVAAGFDVLGFSDHVPFPFAGGYRSTIRMPMSDLDDYVDSVRTLKRKYADRIRIHLGFEAEYFPRYRDHLLRLRDAGTEYFVLGQHYADSEEDTPYTGLECRTDDGVRRYADAVVNGIQTGLFSCVAHPDLMMRHRTSDQFNLACVYASDMICQAAKEADIPIEFNLLGLSLQLAGIDRGYPSVPFWTHVRRWQNRVIIGVDAHSPLLLRDAALWREGHDRVEALGYEITDHLPIDD
ncbi:MAG: histidinol-phosphatase [Clostridia bacterium]|nr:histidinol-phosphatase [Clostridia bacterium]